MSLRAELHELNGGGGRVVLLDQPRFTLGRTKDNSLTVSNPSVSRHHAAFVRLGNEILVQDVGSTNGVFVNGSRASEQLLNDGDVVRLGPAGPEFRIVISFSDGSTGRIHPRGGGTKQLIESLGHQVQSQPGNVCEDASLRCVLAEAYLTKGDHNEALNFLSIFTDTTRLLELPVSYRATVLLWIGRAYADAKRFQEALEVLERSLNLATREDDDNAVAEARATIGRVFLGLGDQLGARDALNRAMLSARRAGNSRVGAEVHLSLGKVDWKDGDFDGARYNWMRSARLAEGLNSPLLTARVEMQQAFVLYSEGKLKQAVERYEAVIEKIQQIGNDKLLLKAYSNLSRALVRLGSWGQARRLLDDRLKLARQSRSTKAEAVALTDGADLELLEGNLPGATAAIEQAVKLHGDKVYARTQRILGRVLVVRGQAPEGIKALEKGLHAAREYGALEENILIGIELALVHIELGDYVAAQMRLDEAEAITPLDPALSLMARALYARGKLHASRGEVAEANRCFAQCLTISQTTGDPYRSALCQAAIGELRARIGRDDSAMAHLEEARTMLFKLGALLDLKQVEARLNSARYANVAPAPTAATNRLSKTALLSLQHLTGTMTTGSLKALTAPKILVAVANDELARLLENGLEVENYIVTRVEDGKTALDLAFNSAPPFEMLLLDALLEHQSGFDICRELRKRKDETPVILFGSRQGVEDKIEALQSGADDFVSKRDLVFEELLAKVDALLR